MIKVLTTAILASALSVGFQQGGAQSRPDDAASLRVQGEVALQNDRPGDAARFFSDALRRSPNDVETMEDLALLHAFDGQFSIARRDATKLLSLDPTNYNAHLLLVSSELQLKQTPSEASCSWLKANAATDPLVAVLWKETSRKLQVDSAFEPPLSVAPKDAMLAAHLFRLSPVAEYATHWIAQLGDDRTAGLLARRLLAEGKYEESKVLLNKQLSRDPKNEQALLTLAQVEWSLYEVDQARETLMKAYHSLDIDPTEMLSFGKVAVNLGDLKNATEILERARDLNPQNAEVHAILGEALYRLGDAKGAIQEFDKAEGIQPGNPLVLVDKAIATAYLNNLREAIRLIKTTIQLDPELGTSHLYLGTFLWQAGDVAEAQVELERAAKESPDVAVAHAKLGNFYFSNRNYEAAEAELRWAVRLDPHAATPHLKLGQLLLRTSRRSEGEAEIAKFREARADEEKRGQLFEIGPAHHDNEEPK